MNDSFSKSVPAGASRQAGLWMLPAGSVAYGLLAYLTTGFRGDHLFFILLVNGLFFASGTTRRFILGFSVFVVYWILYDSMKAWPNYAFAPVDIRDLYELEKNVFGIVSDGQRLIPSEYFVRHAAPWADLLTSLFYLCWIPVPLAFAFYLYATDKRNFLHYSLAFFVINLVGFVVYYTHPAAAPWYVEQHGFNLDSSVKSYAAGLLRTDRLLGFGLFESIYAKGSNVFAAMPSLHSAYPLAGFFYSLRQPRRWITVGFGIVSLGIWISAVYLSHHYTLDVLAGILCGVLGIFLCEKLLFSNRAISGLIDRWVSRIRKPEAISPATFKIQTPP